MIEQYGLDFHDLTNILEDLFTGNDFKWLDFICPFTGACTLIEHYVHFNYKCMQLYALLYGRYVGM